MRTPELRKASSRSRCSSVAKSNSHHGEGVCRRQERDLGAALVVGGADHRERRDGFAVAELHEVFLAVAPDGELEPGRERIDDGNADAMQAARNLVGVLVEFSAGMQLRHDDFGRRHAFALVDVGRDAAAVVAHGAGTVGIEREPPRPWRSPPAPRRWRCRRPRRPCGAGPSRHRCRRYTCPAACARHRGP